MHALRAASAQTRCDRFSSQSRGFIATDMCWSVPHMPATSGCTRSTQRIASVTVGSKGKKGAMWKDGEETTINRYQFIISTPKRSSAWTMARFYFFE